MNEMINYIFNNMNDTSKAVSILSKASVNQKKVNAEVTKFICIFCGYIVVSECRASLQNQKIKELSNKVKELETKKGE